MMNNLSRCYLLILIFGMQIVSQLGAQANENKFTINTPNDPPYRVLQFVLRSNVQSFAYDLIDTAKKSGYNAVMFTLVGDVKFKNAPWSTEENNWSKTELVKWVNYARSKGIDVIPGLNLLTHQEKFTQGRYPDLMFNKVTYDPRKEDIYKLIFPLIDEIIEAIHPVAIHIGHDEVKGHRKLNSGESILPAELFVMDVLRIHGYLKSKNISTWMWGDMLLSPDEFPGINSKNMHGGITGYGKKVRDELPRDIVITDWQYFNEGDSFDTLSVMQKEGFRVIATTWNRFKSTRDFARFAKKNNSYGMMATTWGYFKSGYTPEVENLIRSTGELFRNPNGAKIKNIKNIQSTD